MTNFRALYSKVELAAVTAGKERVDKRMLWTAEEKEGDKRDGFFSGTGKEGGG